MSEPQRIQRKRTAGSRMAENAVYVGRPGKFGNPYAGNRAEAVDLFTVTLAMNRAGSPMVAYPSDAEIRAAVRPQIEAAIATLTIEVEASSLPLALANAEDKAADQMTIEARRARLAEG
jgi:hypothetical protein